MNTELTLGSAIVWKDGTGLYSRLQHWFSGHKVNHIGLYIGQGLVGNKHWIYEASEIMSANPINPFAPNKMVYKCHLDQKVMEEALSANINSKRYRLYAFLQILYFARRKFYETFPWLYKLRRKLFGGPEKITKLNNWFPRNDICSEFWFDVIRDAAHYCAYDLYEYMVENYEGNNLYVSDNISIMEAFPQYFTRIH